MRGMIQGSFGRKTAQALSCLPPPSGHFCDLKQGRYACWRVRRSSGAFWQAWGGRWDEQWVVYGVAANKNCRSEVIKFYLIIISKISLMAFNPQEYVSPYITLDEVLEIKKAFDYFDRDLGGAIDPKELKVAINSLGIEAKAQAVYQMIAELDKDGSGQIEFPEFFYMMTTRPSDNESRDEVHKVFITFDSQKTGFIALKDLRKVAKDLGELTDDTILQEMIERADTDGDGVISEEEFYNLITKKAH